MKKKNNKDLILIGDCITDFFTSTLATLQVAFLLNDEAIYQAINLASCIIAAIINKLIISKGNTQKFYKHRNKLFILESIVNLEAVSLQNIVFLQLMPLAIRLCIMDNFILV